MSFPSSRLAFDSSDKGGAYANVRASFSVERFAP